MSEISPWAILIASIFTSNLLLVNFLGMCSFLACSRQVGTALGLGTAVVFVMVCTTALNWCIYTYVLIPLGIQEHLWFIIAIAVIAAFVQFVEMFVERFSPTLYHALGIFLPLITVNCAILGASLLMITRHYGFIQSVAFGFGGGLGWMLAIVLIAGLRQKMTYCHVPRPFQGVAIIMVITGIMAMIFIGFAGMVKI